MQFWPPDDEHNNNNNNIYLLQLGCYPVAVVLPGGSDLCSKHVEAWNKTYCETNFAHQVG